MIERKKDPCKSDRRIRSERRRTENRDAERPGVRSRSNSRSSNIVHGTDWFRFVSFRFVSFRLFVSFVLELPCPDIDQVVPELGLDRSDGFVERRRRIEAQVVEGRGHRSRSEASQVALLFARGTLGIGLGGLSKHLGVVPELVPEAVQRLEGFRRRVLDQQVGCLDPRTTGVVGNPRPEVGNGQDHQADRKRRGVDRLGQQHDRGIEPFLRLDRVLDLLVECIGDGNELEFFHEPRLGRTSHGGSVVVVFFVVVGSGGGGNNNNNSGNRRAQDYRGHHHRGPRFRCCCCCCCSASASALSPPSVLPRRHR
mmetsp:Transcript_116560/g.238413  ORF Transcript_116560/g.238413 Transcript_116560/m.238413 type:complete len:311 (+) Transcript_116560:441-1373(+)